MSAVGPDARERFLRAIAERIQPQRIAAIHLFPAIRAGALESAVAVIAAEADESYEQAELPPPVGGVPASEASPVETREAVLATSGGDAAVAASGEDAAAPEAAEMPEDPAAEVDIMTGESAAVGAPPPEFHDNTPSADEADHNAAVHIVSPPDRPPRLVVYRAVYRWTRKGPDRGRWEVDVTAEADAPLQAVSDVVRGVQRRAGEDDEPELITPEVLRIALSDRPWAAAM
ncbi:MAG TPA: hypothetical protein VK922_12685 [Gemmatimonadaceae bacterium]|nr:hypothetical protein [Gemmatimonadaceae bacterium]